MVGEKDIREFIPHTIGMNIDLLSTLLHMRLEAVIDELEMSIRMHVPGWEYHRIVPVIIESSVLTYSELFRQLLTSVNDEWEVLDTVSSSYPIYIILKFKHKVYF